jgi:hypothetical protein
VGVERRPVNRLIAGAAMPAGVSAAAVTEAGDVADEDLIRAERVPVGALAGCFAHPFASGCPDEITLHPAQAVGPLRQLNSTQNAPQ